MIGKFGTFAVVLAVGALAVGGVLSVRLARQPPAAFPLPTSVAPTGDAAPADPVAPDGATQAELRDNLKQGRELEVAPMARWPGVARREGDVLTLTAAGRDLASFTDAGYCDGFDQCSHWRFQGVMTLGGKTYPWLTLFHGEGWEIAYLVSPDGGLIGAPGDPSTSPDGHWLVMAFNEPDMDGGVKLFEVRPEGPVLVANTSLGCEPGRWTSGRLALICIIDDMATQRWMSAQLVHRDGVWSIRPIAELDATTKKPLAHPVRPLVEVKLDAVPAKEAKDDLAYENSKGYRKLTPAT